MNGQGKNIDETWKQEAEKQKEAFKDKGEFVPPEPGFNFFITTLALQASIFLGAIENSATNKKEENLPQAKFIIDTLSMLQEKTKGNLEKQEGEYLDNVIYDLRMHYISKTQGGKNDR